VSDNCKHPIFKYCSSGELPQVHECIDCGHEAGYVPDGSVMVGHLPDECPSCDENSVGLSVEDKERWISMTNKQRNL
jgi:hypothetical protein